MSRHWKEPYSLEAAESAGIHTTEGTPVLGEPHAKWIYYVNVCSFTFTFFSLDMIRDYLAFYSQKILPTSRFYGVSSYSNGPAASVGDGQTPFERLPLRLRSNGKREKVVRALSRAIEKFEKEEA